MNDRHMQLRSAAKDMGFKTSYNSAVLSAIVEVGRAGGSVPAGMVSKQRLVATASEEYNSMIDAVTVKQLADGFPEEAWQRTLSNGWSSTPMPLLMLDKRFLKICMFSIMADLGVDPLRADTYASADGNRNYDKTWGWSRNPAFNPGSVFVSTHPTTFR